MTGGMSRLLVPMSRRLGRTLALGAALAVLAVAVLVADWLGGGPGLPAAVLPHAVVAFVALLSAASCVLRAVHHDRERRAWILLAIAVTAMALGWIAWAAWVSRQTAPSTPTASDVLWAIFYPFGAAGL